jgi:hypothetical protein
MRRSCHSTNASGSSGRFGRVADLLRQAQNLVDAQPPAGHDIAEQPVLPVLRERPQQVRVPFPEPLFAVFAAYPVPRAAAVSPPSLDFRRLTEANRPPRGTPS